MRILTFGGTDRIGRLVLVPGAVLVAVLLVCHPILPGGSLLPAVLPWLGLAVPVLLALAAWRRSRPALLAAVLPSIAWLAIFGGHLIPDAGAAEPDLLAVQHNVSDENRDPAGTVRALVATGADLIGLEEVTPEALPAYAEAFPAEYRYFTFQGTVALWSRHPLAEAAALDIRPPDLGADWNRGLRAVARTPRGDVAVYVVHLPSMRLGVGGLDSARRNASATRLGAALAAEEQERIVLLGDLNATVDDRGLEPVTAHVRTDDTAFAFSFPASFPAVRIDHVMARSLTVDSVRTLPETGSDHLPVVARLRF
ncbi:endonuclease/exonuclease/phosphatase family protein [Actinoplanes utahensis]|uniref:endonuclease/exonuclease/phosphatase family protein n=1 Tax=Actinoplanes utahensis TaxID=1869 RepID=UPI0007C76997|nr:endonuclease/exonuclease/phosphatase family protein [Actinoplanes utahensis]